MLNIHIYILSACVLKFAVYCVCLWMSPCRIPYLDHRSISQWKTWTPPIWVHVYWNSLCLWMSPAEFQNWITDLFPSRKPRYLPVSIESYSTCRRCIRVYTVVLIRMTMYVWRRILIRLKIQQEQIRRGVFRAQTKSSSEHACEVKNSYSLRISLVFYWFLTTADAVFLSDFSGPILILLYIQSSFVDSHTNCTYKVHSWTEGA